MDCEFDRMLEKILEFEGDLKLHRNPTEKQKTYAGIYRKEHPNWEGWRYIDKGETPPFSLVKKFYFNEFYKPLQVIPYPKLRFVVFDFAVNTGLPRAVKVLQRIIDAKPDGVIGSETLEKLDKYIKKFSEEDLVQKYTLARVAYYNRLAKNKDMRIYLRGWIDRTLNALKYSEELNGIV
jgi:lysozyme family protein